MNERAKQTIGLFDNIIRWAIIAAVALLPLVLSPVNFDAFDMPKAVLLYALTLVSGASYISRSLLAGEIVIKRTPLNKPLFMFAMTATIATIASPLPFMSFIGEYARYENLPTLYSYALLCFFATQFMNDKVWQNRLVTASFASLGIISIYGILQALGFDLLRPEISKQAASDFTGRVRSTLGNPVFLGGYLAVMLPLLLNYLVDEENLPYMPKVAIGMLMVLGFASAILSGSRGAWLGIIAGMLAVIVLNRKQLLKVAGTASAIAIFGLAFMLLILSIAGPNVAADQIKTAQERVLTATDISQGTVAGRIELWKSSIKMISVRPLIGYGPDQMYLWASGFKSLKQAQLEPNALPDRAHNMFLQVAIDTGLLGLLVFLWIIVTMVAVGNKLLRGGMAANRTYTCGALAAMAAYAVQGISGVSVIGIAAPVWVLAGSITSALPTAQSGDIVISLKTKRYIEVIATVFLLTSALLIFSLKPLIADTFYLDGVMNKLYGQTDRAIMSFNRAIEMYPYQSRYRQDLALTLLSQGNTFKNTAIIEQGIGVIEGGLKYNPEEFGLILAQASSYRIYAGLANEQSMVGQAETYYSMALHKDPYSTSARRGLLGLFMLQEKYTEAIEQATAILQVDPNDSQVKVRLAQAYEKTGKVGRARVIYKELLKANPDQQEIKAALSNIE